MFGKRGLASVTVVVLVMTLLAGCGGGKKNLTPGAPGGGQQPGGVMTLTGGGSTFVYPLFSKMFAEYNKLNPNIRVNYLSIGSGGGIKQLIEKTVDFGATDGPMTSSEESKAGGNVLHIPVTIGAVALAYNVPNVPTGLKFDPETVAGIYLGQIKKWNDPKIAGLNPGVSLPDADITAVYRSDGSGTTFIFTDYLSSVSPEFKSQVGTAKAVKWPTGLGGKGNEGVAGQVLQTPGAIGYVELAYAVQNKMSVVALKNQAGKYVLPSPEGATAAAGAAKMPEDLRASFVNAPGEAAYPISGFTWALVRPEQEDAVKGKAVVDLIWWTIHDGQQYAGSLHYAPLPAEVVTKAEAMLRSVKSGGKVLLSQ